VSYDEVMNSPSPYNLDLSGLPEALARSVESIVSELIEPSPAGPAAFPTREEWAKAIQDWSESHSNQEATLDDSRESIYAGQGE